MATQFEINCALMAGRAYQTNRNEKNWFPVPDGWQEFSHVPNSTYPTTSGFEAAAFQSKTNANQIVISFAGTDGFWTVDQFANFGLATGQGSDQLNQAVDYYLAVRAQNPSAVITFTGHSLGGGLAALMGVFFDCKAVTFDQAPFAASARARTTTLPDGTIQDVSVAKAIRDYLANKTALSGDLATARDKLVADLTGFLTLRDSGVSSIPRSSLVTTYRTDGEFLGAFDNDTKIGVINPSLTHGSYFGPFDLHSQSLLTAFELNDGFRQATVKLTDLLAMVFDKGLFAHDTDPSSDKENLLERLLRHQIGNVPGVTAADKMLTRFTDDLNKIAQVNGLTMSDKSISDGLIAFAMQKYYTETPGTVGSNDAPADHELFKTNGGLHFNINDVSASLGDALGYSKYFVNYLNDPSHFTPLESDVIHSAIPGLTDWYIQSATDILNRGAFMLGGNGSDALTGGTANDLLVGNVGNDNLTGSAGNDTLLGGIGNDTYIFNTGDGADTIVDPDGGLLKRNGALLSNGINTGVGVWKSPDRKTTCTRNGSDLVVTFAGNADSIVLRNFDFATALADATSSWSLPLTPAPDQKTFGIRLSPTNKVVIAPTANIATNLAHTIGDSVAQTTALVEKGTRILSVFASDAVDYARTFVCKLTGADASKFALCKGDDTESFVNGEITLTLAAGETALTFALLSTGDIDASATLDLSATLIDPQVDNSSDNPAPSADIAIAFTAVQEPDTQNRPVISSTPGNGDYLSDTGPAPDILGQTNPSGGPVSFAGNDLGEQIYLAHASDIVDAGGGNDNIGYKSNVIQDGPQDIRAGDGNDIVLAIPGAGGSIKGEAGNDVLDAGQIKHTGWKMLPTASAPQGDSNAFYQYFSASEIARMFASLKDVSFHAGVVQSSGTTVLQGVGDGTWFVKNDGTMGLDHTIVYQSGSGHIEGIDQQPIDFSYDAAQNILTVNAPQDPNIPAALRQGPLQFEWVGNYGYDALPTAPVGSPTLTLDGGDGNDELIANDAGTVMIGGAGLDMIEGGKGDDVAFGDAGMGTTSTGDGNDQILLWSGNDFADGGGGNDYIQGGANNDVIFGGAGDDLLFGDDPITNGNFIAGDGNDYVNGEDGNDILWGGGGDDTLLGGDGNDTLYGDRANNHPEVSGNDWLDGGNGNDLLAGEEGNDTLMGGDGNDSLWGGIGDDVLLGDSGSDELSGEAGNDTLEGGDGSDFLWGGDGNDSLLGGLGDDTLSGEAGDDVLSGGDGNDLLDAGDGNNTLMGDAGNDTLQGGSGNDTLDGGSGDDTLVGQAGDDSLSGGDGNDYLDGGTGSNNLVGGAGDDTLISGSGNDTLDGGDGLDWYIFNAGFGTDHIVDSGSNAVQFDFSFAGSGVVIGLGSLKLSFATGDVLHIDGFDPNDPQNTCSIDTFKFSDRTLSLQDILDLGGAAVDFTKGSDITGTSNADVIMGTDLGEHIYALEGDDSIDAGARNDTVDGGAGNDTLDGGTGADVMMGGDGGDTYCVDDAGDRVIEGDSGPLVTYTVFDLIQHRVPSQGSDTVNASISYTLGANVENLFLIGTDDIDGTGNQLDNYIRGNDGDNVLLGGMGNDELDGGAGVDTMIGGSGDDIYRVDNTDDTIVEGVNGGKEMVWSTADFTMPDNVEDMALEGDAIVGIGNELDNNIWGSNADNLLSGGAGNDFINGGAGADTMTGGLGDDTYFVDNSGDVVVEDFNEGTDTVQSSATFTLGDNIENLNLGFGGAVDGTGNALDNNIIGSVSDNRLSGGAGADTLDGGNGNDTLDGGTGTDVMTGGYGNDTYFVDAVGDQVIEALVGPSWTGYDWLGRYVTVTTQDIDTVNASISYVLGNNLENLNLLGSGNFDGTGNELNNAINGNDGDNILMGNTGDDTLDGGAGADVMDGGAGNDTYFVDNAGDQVIDSVAGIMNYAWWASSWYLQADYETVNASVSFTLGNNLEQLNLTGPDNIDGTGNELNNLINGNDGNNVLSGLDGNDTLNGGAGNDVLSGGAGNDTLDGGTGADTMDGGSGDDIYIVENLGDAAIEISADGGFDQVGASVDFTLGANIEVLDLLGTAIVGTGNESDNRINGNDAANVLSGMGGNDSIEGGQGNDLIQGGEGNDTLKGGQSGDWDWRGETPITNEDTLDGGDGNDFIDGGNGNDTITGGAGDDTLLGGNEGRYDGLPPLFAGNDLIDGGDGNDSIDGGDGSDRLYGGAGDDSIFGGYSGEGQYYDYATQRDETSSSDDYLNGGEGNDTLDGGDGNDTLIGGEGNDSVRGGDGNDILYSSRHGGFTQNTLDSSLPGFSNDDLDATTSIDTLEGGRGDDVYVVDGLYSKVADTIQNQCGDQIPVERLQWTTDTVTEYAWDGYDKVISSGSFVLSDNIEELQLVFDPNTATTDPQYYADMLAFGQDGTGNAEDNLIVGNALANRLEGGAGADTLVGGAGNDTYVIDALDTIVENADEGIDTVLANFSYSLDNTALENLTLLDAATDGQGNAAANILVGNDEDNSLDGMEGNDTLTGGKGDDTLTGGKGDDTYVFRLGDGADVIDDWQGNDTLYIGNDLTAADIKIDRDGQDLKIGILGTEDSITLTNWFTQAEGVKQIEFCESAASLDLRSISFPEAAVAIPDQITHQGASFRFTVPAGTFADSDANAMLAFSATLADGTTLPGWLSFDAATNTFSGTPDNWDVASLDLTVTATDKSGQTASSNFVLDVLNVNDAPTVVNPLPDQSAVAGETFGFTLPSHDSGGGFMNDPTDLGTPDQVEINYDNYLSGGVGNDTYDFGRGDGNVYLSDWDQTPGNVDTVRFGAGLTPADISVRMEQWGNVVVSINGTGDSLTMEDWLYTDATLLNPDPSKIERLVFADGSVWNVADIMARISTSASTGNDYIVGRNSGGIINGLAGNDMLTGGNGNDRLLGGTGNDILTGGSGDDLLLGGAGNDSMNGSGDSDILVGGSGNDAIYASWPNTGAGNDLLDGSSGDDDLRASLTNDLLIGGQGNDILFSNNGNDVLLFNRGDGLDEVDPGWDNEASTAETSDTLSLGGGITYADLSFSRDGDNLILNTGNEEGLTFDSWFYTDSGYDNKTIKTLQIVADGMPGYSASSSDPLLNQRIYEFDFVALADQFAAALQADPTLSDWSLAPHLSACLQGSSDSAAIGGDMAYAYGKNGNLDRLSESALRAQLNDAQFGIAAQAISVDNSPATFNDIDAIYGDTLTYSATRADGSALPAWLNFGATTGKFSGTPGNGDIGNLVVAVIATDSGGLSARDEFTLHVTSNGVNAAPVAANPIADQVTHQDDDFSFTVPANAFVDPDGDTLKFAANLTNGDPLPAWLSFDATSGTFSGTPGNADVTLAAPLNLTVTATDPAGLSASRNFTLDVQNVNDLPIATGEHAVIDEDTILSYVQSALLANDVDIDPTHDVLRISAVGNAAHGQVTMDAGNVVFTPDANYNGTAGFDYTVIDGQGGSANASVVIDVLPINDAPVAAADSASVREDTLLEASGNVLSNDSDVDAGTLLQVGDAGVRLGAFGTLTLQDDGSYRYVLDNASSAVQSLRAGAEVTETFSYSANDGMAGVSSTLTVTITGTNDTPVALLPLTNQTADESAPFAFTMPPDTFGDVDTGDVLTYSARMGDGNALPTWLSFNAATGSFTGTPAQGNVGDLNISVTATDSGGLSASEEFMLHISSVNHAPVAANPIAGQVTHQGDAFSFVVPANAFTDPDGDTLKYAVSQSDGSPLPAWLHFDAASGTFSGTPGNADVTFVAPLNLTVTATDLDGLSAHCDFTLDVLNVNDAPVTTGEHVVIDEDTVLSYTQSALLANDGDIDPTRDVLRISTVSNAAHGQVTMDAGNVVFTPDANYNGSAGFDYTVIDGLGGSANASVVIDVLPVNDAPVALLPLSDQTTSENTLFAFTMPSGTFGDVDIGDVLAYSATLANGSALPAWLSFDPATRRFSGMPAHGDIGSLSIKVTATDLAGATASENFALAIEGTGNAPPMTVQDKASVTEDSSLTAQGNVLANDSDQDAGTVLRVADSGVRQGTYGKLTLSSDGSYRYVLANASNAVQSLGIGQSAIDRFTYQASDGAASATGELLVTVSGKNDIPILAVPLQNRKLTANTDVIWQVPANSFTDVDRGDVLSYRASLANGAALPKWLVFDTVTRTFRGHVPKDATGTLNVRVTASDGHGTKSAASDIFSITLSKENSHGDHGNEGVGNGQDDPPPGHDTNWNDGTGTSPGNPGNSGGNGTGDAIHVIADANCNQIWLKHTGNDLELSVIGTTEKLTMTNWYSSSSHPDLFETADNKVLSSTQVEKLVQAMASFDPPPSGQMVLPHNYQESLAPVIAANWH